MKLTLTVTSWIAIVIGVLAVLGGLGALATDPTGARNSFIGAAMFAGQGILALIYINQTEEK